MQLVIIEYTHQPARMHTFRTKEEADRYVSLVANSIGVVAAYLTDESKKYQWPSDMIGV